MIAPQPVDVIGIVDVSVITTLIVAALVSGNDAVGVIHTVDIRATGGWGRPTARACCDPELERIVARW